MLIFSRTFDSSRSHFTSLKLKHLRHMTFFTKHAHPFSTRTTNFIKWTKIPLNSRKHFSNCTKSKWGHSTRFMSSSSDKDPGLDWKLDNKVYDQGPDQILPSKALYTWHVDGAVQLRDYDKSTTKFDFTPKSIPSFVTQAVNQDPQYQALAIKRDGEWKKWTAENYYKDIQTIAKAFIASGLERHKSVCILANNCPEWFMSNYGAIFAGGISAGVYLTNNPDAVAHCGEDSQANIFVVQDDIQLKKVLKIRHRLKHLKKIIVLDNSTITDDGVISWSQLLKIGQDQPESVLNERLKQIALNQCCSIIYTSGTTGIPKGVMLSHDNFYWTLHSFPQSLGLQLLTGPQSIISYLPLSHVAAQLADLYACLHVHIPVYFGDKNALKGTLINTLREIQPTIFLGVPRVFEKIQDSLNEYRIKNNNPLRNYLVDFGKRRVLKYYEMKFKGVENPKVWGYNAFEKIIFSRIRQNLGFANNQLAFNGAAPVATETLTYFLSFNLPIFQVYGLTETTGSQTYHNYKDFRIGSNGKVNQGQDIKILPSTEKEFGEVCLFGRNVMMGYLGHEDKTKETFTPDGYFITGDLGYVDTDGFLWITGRQKDIIITAGGENVAPVEIEDRLKSFLPFISNAAVVGDKMKCLTVILTLKTLVDAKNEPTDKLAPFVQDWVSTYGDLKVTSVSEVLPAVDMNSKHKLRQAIEKRIQSANLKSISHAQHIQNWCILPRDFSVGQGELGPTLKLKRNDVNKKYASYIKAMYAHLDAVKDPTKR